MTTYASSHASPRLVAAGFYPRSGSRGVTLIDTIVGVSLMLVVFVGINAVFRLSVDIVTNNKARAGAIALGDQRMEYIRSLSYAAVGTQGGIPSGSLAQSETLSLNGVTYTRRTIVVYADDPKDGLGAADNFPQPTPITADYKAVKVDVAWTTRLGGTRHVDLVTRVSPPTSAGETNPCSGQCGTLVINAVNAISQPVVGASVTITNSTTNPAINFGTFTNASGTVTLLAAPAASGYHVVVTNTGYSTAQTYDVISPNTNPAPGNLTVSNNQTTTGTFAIDLLSSVIVNTYSLSTNSWTDSFGDTSKVGTGSYYIEVTGNQARFAGNQPWTGPAELQSIPITPVALSRWGIFSRDDNRPSLTTITYHVYYPNGPSLALVPDSVLPGNSVGFTGTSTDLSAVPALQYPTLVLDAYLLAQDPNAPSPTIQDWSLTYQSGQGIAIPFTMTGAKIIGNGPPLIYKYNQSLTTDGAGSLTLPAMEWDTYTMTFDPSTGYDVASSCPRQPLVLPPNSSATTTFYLAPHTANSLLVEVKNGGGAQLSGATVRLTKGGSYDQTVFADACGQSFFGGLTNGTYSISVSASGYQTYSSSGVNVSGTSKLSVTLN